ncbi:hypothetical protein EBR78_03680 [bacterium]|nr:hypothetical protein [bacterium]NBX83793.1 hypothetical protein [bacterium]
MIAVLLLAVAHSRADLNHRSLENPSQGKRGIERTWSPKTLIAGMWDRINGPHTENWSQKPPDLFESELSSIRARLKDFPHNLDNAEIASLKNRLEKLENTQTVLIKQLERIKSNIAEDWSGGEKKKLEDVIRALELRLREVQQVQSAFKRGEN